MRKTLRRAHVLPFFAALPPCLIGIEAAKWSLPQDRETPFKVVRKTRETHWRPDPRTSSGPAAFNAAYTRRTYDCTRPAC